MLRWSILGACEASACQKLSFGRIPSIPCLQAARGVVAPLCKDLREQLAQGGATRSSERKRLGAVSSWEWPISRSLLPLPRRSDLDVAEPRMPKHGWHFGATQSGEIFLPSKALLRSLWGPVAGFFFFFHTTWHPLAPCCAFSEDTTEFSRVMQETQILEALNYDIDVPCFVQ